MHTFYSYYKLWGGEKALCFFVFDFVKAEPVDAAFEIKRKAARADVTKYPAVSTPNRHRRRPMDR